MERTKTREKKKGARGRVTNSKLNGGTGVSPTITPTTSFYGSGGLRSSGSHDVTQSVTDCQQTPTMSRANFYESNEDGAGFYWTPGRRLPFGPSSDPSSQFCHDVRDYGSAGVESANSSASASIERLFSSLENTLDSKLSNLCEKVDNMTSRMQLLEKRQEALEEEIRLSSPSVSSSPVTTPGSGNRRRRTPVALQVT